ncbi:ABC transporter permease [Virgisporangium aliadipatigenens]|uniref:ABC transporter permease n=1 Tax=Virgisporangium aliadipatigenens TaxID=741659 RepID=A0A8J3YQF7_9ACTN|nr:ABC-2 family transporter protein [Virgisporangium aliadipatigenens]GIJ47918.1 ABC transporter permease [Virgisporangium aliadipatigenens]
MRALRLIALHLRVVAMYEMQYRMNFFLQLFQSALATGTGLVVLALVYAQVDELRGWSRPELLVVLGVFTIIGGVLESVVKPNLVRFMEEVADGRLDFVLAKPVDAQLLISIRAVRFWQAVDVLVGAVVLGVGASRLTPRPGALAVLGFAAGLLFAVVILYSFLLILATSAFWFVRVDSFVETFDGVFQAGRWPIGIYPGWLRTGLTVVVPVGFAVTVPAELLTDRSGWVTLAAEAALAAALAGLARLCWRLGLRRYGGASA